ncbi:MAG: NAD-dependent epimerase/dehydratase family protein [Eubacterium sp.]|nr:NAD-dependent epimerase/dehydratase family protein [Eubacterium sp.]
MKKILVVGKGSYIGTSFINYMATKYSDEYQFEELDTFGEEWKCFDYSNYDVVYQVAGIAHIKETPENSCLYYKVNRDMAIEIAKLAKNAGVKQFIYLSSMSVYGMTMGEITPKTIPNPTTNYGKSKLQAEKELKKLNDDKFCVTILRPPMVYGKGCKGNFQSLVKIAKILPIFPYLNNERSMIYINNLNEFVKLVMDKKKSGVFCPQNQEYSQTTDLIVNICEQNGKKVVLSHILGAIILLFRNHITVLKKAFGTLIYKDTEEFNYNYCKYSLKESIEEIYR